MIQSKMFYLQSGLLGLLFLYWLPVAADWTGIRVELGDTRSDWEFSNDSREVKSGRVSLQIEEKSKTDLTVGVSLGQMSLRVASDQPADTHKFDAQFLGVYLRQPVALSEHYSLHGLFSYHYNSGRDNDEVNPAEIDWNETQLQLGVSANYANFRITAFSAYYHVDGDISDNSGTEVFELEDAVATGIKFDYFVEKTAYVRLQFQSGAYAGGFLTFAREYW